MWPRFHVTGSHRKSRVLGGKTADQVQKGIVGSGWGKTAEKRGLKVQSPIFAAGVLLESKQHKKNAMKHALLVFHSYFLTTSGKNNSKHGIVFTRS